MAKRGMSEGRFGQGRLVDVRPTLPPRQTCPLFPPGRAPCWRQVLGASSSAPGHGRRRPPGRGHTARRSPSGRACACRASPAARSRSGPPWAR
eukprot:scaffold19382_cov75-Phaeocystis_antarctica.AAC.5